MKNGQKSTLEEKCKKRQHAENRVIEMREFDEVEIMILDSLILITSPIYTYISI